MDAIRAATNNERFVTYRSDLEAAIRIVNESGTEKEPEEVE